jgi:membrane protease YdiL (CAAX protease family)
VVPGTPAAQGGSAEPGGSVDRTVGWPSRRLRERFAIDPAAPPETTLPRRVLRNEVLLVLAVSLGASAVYAVLSLLRKLLAPIPLSQSQATLNGSVVPNQAWLDLVYQLVGIGFGVVPAFLALHLLARDRISARAIGVDGTRPRADLGRGALLAAVIGIPGLLLYVAAHALGISATIVPSGLPDVWWRIPVLILSAATNATLEEVVVLGYLVTRLRQLGRSAPWAIGLAAVLRGSYHLYQGFGAFIGNAVMGVVFGWFFLRTRRVMPLIVAHTILDTVSFVGYALLSGHVSWLP